MTCKTKLPLRRSYSSWSFGKRRTGRPHKHERPRAETEILRALLALDPDQFDALDLTDFLFGDEQVLVYILEKLADGLQPGGTVTFGRK